MHAPDKYLALHASFQIMKSELSKIGITHVDVPGVFSGSTVSFVGILQEIFLSRRNRSIQELCITKYRLSVGMTDLRFIETVFRISRCEFGLTSKLTADQFLHNGGFTMKKIEFLTSIARAVGAGQESQQLAKYESRRPPSRTCNAPVMKTTCGGITCSVMSEESGIRTCPEPHVTLDGLLTEKILNLIAQVSEKVSMIDLKISDQIETISARMTLVEGRLRLFDKLGSSGVGGSGGGGSGSGGRHQNDCGLYN